VQEAIDLAGIARRVILVHDGTPPALQHASIATMAGRIVALQGVDSLCAITVDTPLGLRTVPTGAVFAYAGRRPEVSLARTLLDLDASGHIMVDADFRTSVASIFACGDVRGNAPQCIASAMQDGARAGREAVRCASAARRTEPAS
jgi:thioredoxin reductase